MRLATIVLFVLSSFALAGQPAVNLNTFHFGLDFLGTLPTMIEDDERFKDRFSTGGGITVAYHRLLSSRLSFEAGLGFQHVGLRQRSRGLSFACDAPPLFGGQGQMTYVDAETGISSLTLPLALMIHLNGTRDGIYLKPGLRTQLNINSSAGGQLHECGSEEGRDVAVTPPEVSRVSFFPGLSLGYQFESDKMRTSYLEVSLSTSVGRITDTEGNIGGPAFQGDAGALLGGVSFGWQFGGKDKDRRPKKEQPAPVPGFYSGR